MTSPLKKLLADCFKTFSGGPEDWTGSERPVPSLLYIIEIRSYHYAEPRIY